MIKKIKVPGIGQIEVDLVMHPSVKEGTLHVTKMSEKFFVVKYREFHDPSDLQLIAGVKGQANAEKEDHVMYTRLEEKKRQVREMSDPVIGHISKEIM